MIDADIEAAQNLKFEREDWTSFRTIDGLQQKAGVSKDKLPKLVLKELADNGLDAGAEVSVGELPSGGYYIEDDGPGIDGTPEDIARLFSIRRPLVSTKLLRRPVARSAMGCVSSPLPFWHLRARLRSSLTITASCCVPNATDQRRSSAPRKSNSRSAPASKSYLVRRCHATSTR
jgi:hypothetical protein